MTDVRCAGNMYTFPPQRHTLPAQRGLHTGALQAYDKRTHEGLPATTATAVLGDSAPRPCTRTNMKDSYPCTSRFSNTVLSSMQNTASYIMRDASPCSQHILRGFLHGHGPSLIGYGLETSPPSFWPKSKQAFGRKPSSNAADVRRSVQDSGASEKKACSGRHVFRHGKRADQTVALPRRRYHCGAPNDAPNAEAPLIVYPLATAAAVCMACALGCAEA